MRHQKPLKALSILTYKPNYLDAIVVNKYQRNAEVLRAWKTASHVERAPKREKKDDDANGTDPNQ